MLLRVLPRILLSGKQQLFDLKDEAARNYYLVVFIFNEHAVLCLLVKCHHIFHSFESLESEGCSVGWNVFYLFATSLQGCRLMLHLRLRYESSGTEVKCCSRPHT